MTTATDVVRAFLDLSAAAEATKEQFLELTHEELRVRTRPNLVAPNGHERSAVESIAALRLGQRLVKGQRWDVHELTEYAEGRVVLRATWSATLGLDAGELQQGATLRAEVAAFATVRDGKLVEYETFDCYYAPEPPAQA